MRKALPYLGASLSVLALLWSGAAQAQEPFKDVPADHWAYKAVTDLQQKKIVEGYPNGTFSGKRVLTRYEFAVALARALQNITLTPGPAGPPGTAGADGQPGPQGPQGVPGMTPEEVAELKRLTTEFQDELKQLGTNVQQIGQRLDALSKSVDEINRRLDRMVTFSGDFFAGATSRQSRFAFLDYSGAVRGGTTSLFTDVAIPHDFHLGVKANLPGQVKFIGDIVNSNYASYRQGGSALFGNVAAANTTAGAPSQTFINQAELVIPFGGFGSGTQFEIGRVKAHGTALTYYRPDTDAYFDLPWYDDGNYVHDGFKFQSKFGSATTSLWAGSYSSTTTTNGAFINKPIVGSLGGPRQFSTFKPFNLAIAGQGGIEANQGAGLHLGIPLFRFGELGLTLEDFSLAGQASTGAGFPAAPYNNVVVYGANVKLNAIGRFQISGEAAKSVTQFSVDRGDGLNNEDNNAYTGSVGYNSGPVAATVGYQYIDPRFSAPGYWNKIGNWYNPTNVKGPFARVGYRFSNVLQGNFGVDYLEGARNRPSFIGGFNSGFTPGSNILRANAGVKFHLSKMVDLSGQYEGVFYELSPSVSFTGTRSKPVEQYITLGAGLNLASNTVLKLAYQIIANSNDAGFGGAFGGGGGIGNNQNASVFTTQVAVHF